MKRKIKLRDPEFEPTDEEIKELMHSAFAQVRAKREARERAVADEISAQELRQLLHRLRRIAYLRDLGCKLLSAKRIDGKLRCGANVHVADVGFVHVG